jgi:hypothetical protein
VALIVSSAVPVAIRTPVNRSGGKVARS